MMAGNDFLKTEVLRKI